jgi:hypothetical protein
VIKELHHQGLDAEIQNLFSLLKNSDKLIIDAVLDSDHIIANELTKIHQTHYSDALHKVIAKRNKARYLVTRNIKDFACFTDLIVVRPDDI